MSGSKGRQHLRPWLISKINSGEYPGLEWIHKDQMEFKIPWKHGSKHDWSPNEAKIFQDWARHTGKFTDNDKPDWVTWKTRLRCAFNKAPDIHEIKVKRCYEGQLPYRVYKFSPRHDKKSPKSGSQSPWSQSNSPELDLAAAQQANFYNQLQQHPHQQLQPQLQHQQQQQHQYQLNQMVHGAQMFNPQQRIKSENPTSPLEGHDASSQSPVLPTMVADASDASMNTASSGALSNLMNRPSGEFLPITTSLTLPSLSSGGYSSLGDCRMDTSSSGGGVGVGGQDLVPTSSSEEDQGGAMMGAFPSTINSMSPENSHQHQHHHQQQHQQHQHQPQQYEMHSPDGGSQYGAAGGAGVHYGSGGSAAYTSDHLHQFAEIAVTSNTHGSVSESITQQIRNLTKEIPHDNCPMHGEEMELEIYYKNNIAIQEHITIVGGTRLYYGGPSEATDTEVQRLLQVERHDIQLPVPHNLLGQQEAKCIKYIDALLQYMQRGLIIECEGGDIYATRLCRTAAYYATYFTQDSQKIERPENGPPNRVKMFDFAVFKKAVDECRQNPSNYKTPSPDIHLFIGQRGTAAQFSKVLICAKVWSCKAKAYCNRALKEISKDSLSLEISDPHPGDPPPPPPHYE